MCEGTLICMVELGPSQIASCPPLGSRGVHTNMTCPGFGGEKDYDKVHPGAGSRFRNTWVEDSRELGPLCMAWNCIIQEGSC